MLAIEGDKVNAALSAFSALPGIGDLAGISKFGFKGFAAAGKCANALTDAGQFYKNVRRLEQGIQVGQGAYNVAQGGYDIYQNGLSLGNAAQVGLGLLGMKAGIRGTQLPCFVAGTLVSTPSGPKPIESILSGDSVWGFDQRRGQWRSCMVSYHSAIAYDDLVVTVRANGAEVRSTYHHPYLVVSGEELDARPVPEMLGESGMEIPGVAGRWVDAGDLRVGDVLFSRETGTSSVESVDTEHQPVQVFHIYVEELHNYAVGDGEWLVHNGHRTRNPDGTYAYDGGPVGGGLTRTTLRAGLRDAVDEAAGGRNSLNQLTDEFGNAYKNPHYAHKKGFENRRILAAGQQLKLRQEQLNDFVNSRPDYFEIQEAAENWSHAGEKLGVDDLDRILDDMRVFFNL